MPLFKTVTIAGKDALLRSLDNGRTWFSAPKDLLAFHRERERRLAELREQWAEEEMRHLWTLGIPEDCFPVRIQQR